MCISHEDERALELAAHALHDSIVRVPGGSRIQRFGKSIKHFGAKLAAEYLGRSADEVRNMADPRKTDHKMYASELHLLLLKGMDPAWLDEVERSIGRVAIVVPDVGEHHDLSNDLMKAIKEFGDLGKEMGEILADGKVTPQEMARYERETDEAMAAIIELREALRAKVVVR